MIAWRALGDARVLMADGVNLYDSFKIEHEVEDFGGGSLCNLPPQRRVTMCLAAYRLKLPTRRI